MTTQKTITCNIMGVNVCVTNMEKTIDAIRMNIDNWRGKYICVANVHTTVMASENESYRNVQNSAVMVPPDGKPLSMYSHECGFHEAERVTGPDLMRIMLKLSEKNGDLEGLKHFFYGSTQDTIDKLKQVIKERYPGADICGMVSPPFRELSESENTEMINLINDAKPDIVWVGLGAPKQEIWMYDHRDKVKALMIGVGAAFDYESGNINRAPMWMQKMSLEWLYRLFQDPKRLLKRYLITNTKYVVWKTKNKNNRHNKTTI